MKRLALFNAAAALAILAVPAMAQDRTPYEESVIAQRGWDIHGCDTSKFVFVYMDAAGPSNRENLAYISGGCPVISGLGDDEWAAMEAAAQAPAPDNGNGNGNGNGRPGRP